MEYALTMGLVLLLASIIITGYGYLAEKREQKRRKQQFHPHYGTSKTGVDEHV